MLARAKLKILSAAAAIIVAIAIYWFGSYSVDDFNGSGPMKDTGFFSYYRYHAPIGGFPLNEVGTYQFEFSGLPNEEMVLQFYVPGYSSKDRDELEILETTISAEIMDHTGELVCSAKGSPAESSPEKWILMSNYKEAAFWHEQCSRGIFSRGTKYSIRVTIEEIDSRTPAVQAIAMLEGGGNELP